MDFIHDCLEDGRTFRVLTLIDAHTRESLVLFPAQSIRGMDVVAALERAAVQHGIPESIRVDNGTEFTSQSLDQWAYWNKVKLDFSRPGKPTDNAYIESFHDKFRKECLSTHCFMTLAHARADIEIWRCDYNTERPHSSLGNLTPCEYSARLLSAASATPSQLKEGAKEPAIFL